MWRVQLKKIFFRNVGGVRQHLSQQILNYFSVYDKNLGSDADALLDALIETMSSEIFENVDMRKILFSCLDPQTLHQIANLLGIAETGLHPIQLGEKIASNFRLTDDLKKYFEETLQLEGLFPVEEDTPKKSKDGVLEPNPASEDYFELHHYQSEMRERIVDTIRESPDSKILIRVPTGGGKTRIGLHTVFALQNFEFKHGDLALWLAYQPVLLEQAHETALKIFPALGKKTMQFRRIDSSSKIFISEDAGILFANPTTLNRADSEILKKLRERARLVVFDETHQIVAANALEFITKLIFKNDKIAVLGMTATPARADLGAQSARLARFFDHKFDIAVPRNNVLIGDSEQMDDLSRERNAIHYLQEIDILAKLREERHFVDCGDLGVEHPDRTKKIIELCELHSIQKKKVLVFAENVRDAHALSFLLKLKSIPNELVLGKNKRTRKAAIQAYRESDDMNILISVDVLTTGFDAPETNVLLIARSTGSAVLFSQILGRALRGKRNQGHGENLVLHVTDPKFIWAKLYETFTDYMR